MAIGKGGTYYDPEELERQVKQLGLEFQSTMASIDTELDKAIVSSCILVEAQASVNSPVDTGLLRKSITYVVEKESGKVEGIVGTNVLYAPFIEYGTSRMEAQPFLEPALTDNQGKITELIDNALGRGLK